MIDDPNNEELYTLEVDLETGESRQHVIPIWEDGLVVDKPLIPFQENGTGREFSEERQNTPLPSQGFT